MKDQAAYIAALRSAVPQALRELPVWLLWKSVQSGDKKPKKIPYYVTGNKRHGTLDAPADRERLVTFERAAAALTNDYAGLGVALGKVPDTETQLAGIDLDVAPGQSGNPGGRPRVVAEIRALAQQHGPEAIQRLVKLMRSKNERVAALASQALLDRGYGRPEQAISVTPAPNIQSGDIRPEDAALVYTQLMSAEPGAVDLGSVRFLPAPAEPRPAEAE